MTNFGCKSLWEDAELSVLFDFYSFQISLSRRCLPERNHSAMIDFNVIYLLSVAVTSWGIDPKPFIEFLRMTFNFVYFFMLAYNDTSTNASPIFPTSCRCFVIDIRVSKQALMSIRVTGWFDVPEDVLSRPPLRCRTFKTWNFWLVRIVRYAIGGLGAFYKTWTWFNKKFLGIFLIWNEKYWQDSNTINSDFDSSRIQQYIDFRKSQKLFLFEFWVLPSEASIILKSD